NMCLFYCAIAASVSYYDLTFWRLAHSTKAPALWASMGRVLDSFMVLVMAGIQISRLPAALVLALDLAGLAVLIVLMTVSGAFDLGTVSRQQEVPSFLTSESTLEQIRAQYALTPRETDVLRELVLTEDKQTAISERLSITVKALQKYVTSLYKKTGASTRSGLMDLYHRTMNGR
ncbi:MAG: response regulator transcription factor, partial [Ruminococcus sp.]|nr:response regulator transcription factor [Ruminococcus sp.]